ncbi:hypothetical protein RFM26_04830 [Mesorhizobium sp. VK23B]|uniref:Uncharacterized protein n=1 Tax=Mesorhizobium dulcispinae TaxID=3072316 RepID=A0ABU4XGL8_9HYPH|nr:MULTISPECIES: hypothetical protein [unclassified Mesorhizobium]MDX8465006.1 hypothetical protein [Mesorhizobium sp. VK23B]MDX8472777.1 hypothetical protein [Mesorhizobium sp. VK23A]
MIGVPSASRRNAERISPALPNGQPFTQRVRGVRDEKTIDAKMFFHDKRHYPQMGACQSARTPRFTQDSRP